MMYGFDTPLEETVFYKEILQEGIEQGIEQGLEQGLEQKEKQAIKLFEAYLKEDLVRGVITEEGYQQKASSFRARLADKQDEA